MKKKKNTIKGSELPVIGDLLVVTKSHSWSAADGQSLQKVNDGDLILVHDIKHNQTDVEIHASTQDMQKITNCAVFIQSIVKFSFFGLLVAHKSN